MTADEDQNKNLGQLWNNKAIAFNDIMNFIMNKGLTEESLIEFRTLLNDYIKYYNKLNR